MEGSTDKLVIAQLCDPQIGFRDYPGELAAFRRAVELINAGNFDAAVICGDLVHVNDEKSYDDIRRALDRLTVPVYCAPGNHDIGGPDPVAAIERYRDKIGKDYFAFDLKEYRFIVLNTQLYQQAPALPAETMDCWLRRELDEAVAAGRKVVIVAHVPLFVEEPDEPAEYFNIEPERRAGLLRLFAEKQVVAYLAGHTHTAFTLVYDGILFSSGENTSVAFDGLPAGFRSVEFSDGLVKVKTITVPEK